MQSNPRLTWLNRSRHQLTFIGIVLLLSSAACAAVLYAADPTASSPDKRADAAQVIARVPHVRQRPDFCGEACAEMWLRKLGQDIDQNGVFNASGLDPVHGRGCYARELNHALEQLGFNTGPVFYKVDVTRGDVATAKQLEAHWATVQRDLAAGVPSILCMHFDAQPKTTEHFRLILGYDATSDEVIYHEPAEKDGAYRRMKRQTLLTLWPLKYDAKTWTLVSMRLETKKVIAPAATKGFTAADYAQHILKLKEKLPNRDFHILVEAPFVVIGDEDRETVERRAKDTVRWAVKMLKQDYFTKDPAAILDIWLFKDEASYEKHATALFRSKPSTPYGYYSPTDRALVMNISTGGGTLVHEIVHPFMATNFPGCPSWFNEGLASLYEQSAERDGRIRGNVNWRLNGLQQTIAQGKLPSFKTLCGTTTDEFYSGDYSGSNYGQARYLCYYLQEQGKLVEFYKNFVKNSGHDRTGYGTLVDLLKEDDMAAFQKRWEKYVAGLKYR